MRNQVVDKVNIELLRCRNGAGFSSSVIGHSDHFQHHVFRSPDMRLGMPFEPGCIAPNQSGRSQVN